MAERLVDSVRSLLDRAIGAYAGTPVAERLRAAQERLDGPLRVAVAGKMKAGKSTLLNALVGEELAPTDAGECTRIVTWYRDGHTYQVTLHAEGGVSRQVPFRREDGAIEIDLVGYGPDDVDHLTVDWPSASLREVTLIDTPGIDSLSTDVSARTHAFLTPGDDEETPADAVLYLMRHLHANDVRFLEAFHDDAVAQATPVNAVGVLSRADEIGVGRLDAMEAAARIAARYRAHPKVRRLCQTVVPVAGLLAQGGATLREAEFQALRGVAAMAPGDREAALLSVDRFIRDELVAEIDSVTRRGLLDRFGLYGVRLAVSLLAEGRIDTADALAQEFVRRSGLVELREVLASQFARRRDVLKARSGLLALEAALTEAPPAGDHVALLAEVERVWAGAHEIAELRLLNALRAGRLALPEDELRAAERLLGTEGDGSAERLGLPDGADPQAIQNAALAALSGWRRRAENPLTDRTVVDGCQVLVRTCEGILATSAEEVPG